MWPNEGIVQDVTYVVQFSNGSCHGYKASSRANFVALQLNHWIPFALSDHGLTAAVFLQSCHSLKMLHGCQSYADMSTEYRLQCIQSTSASLSSERMSISDATIAKVMIMAFEEVSILPDGRMCAAWLLA